VGGYSTASVTQERALTLAPVFAASRHLGDNISTLPMHSYRRVDNLRQPMARLPVLFRQLEEDGELVDWLFAAVSSLALRGNTVGLITQRDGMGFPTAITWLSMSDIYVDDFNPGRPQWYWKGRRLDRSELVHIPWFKIAGRTLGLSPIEAYAMTITTGLEGQRYGTDWFLAGGVPPGTFKNAAKKIDQDDADAIKNRLVAAIRSHKPIVYGADWDYNPISIPPAQADLIQSLKLNANQIAAIYGIAPEEIGGEAANSLTYANEEMRQTTRMANLRPWVVRFERKFSSWIPRAQYVRLKTDATIRADIKSRFEVYKIARDIGLNSIDELRALEDLPPLPNNAGASTVPLSNPALPTPRANGHGQPYDWANPVGGHHV
jgi:HK97 family phage portal protein